MRIPWCMTDHGPRIMTTPSAPAGWWDETQNWVFGSRALESFAGVTVEPASAKVDYQNV